MHIITGGSDAEQRRDGDYLTKDERYDRTDEYLDIVKQAWTAEEPFGYHGRHYQVEDFYSTVKSPQQPRITLYFGGSSAAAYRVGGKHADVYALWGEPLAETDGADRLGQRGREAGRPRHPAADQRQLPADPRPDRGTGLGTGAPHPGGHQGEHRRLQEQAPPRRLGDRRHRAGEPRARSGCWRPPPRASCTTARCGPRSPQATGAAGNSTALVGTPETVAQALLDYIDIGVTTILIRGYDPYDDAIDYGRFLLPLVREEVARRDAEKQAVSA